MADYAGKIVEFVAEDEAQVGFVLKQTSDRLVVRDERGREATVSPAKVVLVVSPPPSVPRGPGELIRQWNAQVQSICSTIDLPLLWETVAGESREYDLSELATIYFARATPEEHAALFRVLMGDEFFFKRVGIRFKPRTPAQVEELQRRLDEQRRREALRQQSLEWLRSVLAADEPCEIPPEFTELVDRIEAFLLKKQGGDVVGLLSKVHEEMTAREVAFDVLVKVGRLEASVDPLLVIGGIRQEFSAEALQAVNALTPFHGDDTRTDFTRLEAFAIDDEETQEVDDAFTVEFLDETVRLGIHIADVGYFVAKGDPLDAEAYQRAITVYLPTGRIPMLPERLAFDLASLQQGAVRPVMSFLLECDRSGEIRRTSIEPGVIRIARRLTYEEADQLLASSSDAALVWLSQLASRHLEWRLERGGLLIRRPEMKVRVKDGQISLKQLDPWSPSRMIVSELMILANWLAAEQAAIGDLPIIFRAQDPPAEPIDPALMEAVRERYDPVALEKVVKLIRRSKLSLFPQSHTGLGLSAYTQLTSPIRRFADLVMQRQLMAAIRKEQLPYERDELLEVLATVESAEREIRALEAKATRYWILEFLRGQPQGQAYRGIVVRRMPGFYLVELSDYLVRGILRTKDSLDVGDHLMVTIAETNPKTGTLRLQQCE